MKKRTSALTEWDKIKDSSIVTTSGEILTWKMYDEIAQIKDSSLRHFVKEDEAKRLILEI